MYALEHTSRSPGKSRSLSSELGKFSLRELYALAHTAYRNTALHGEKKELSDRVRAETHQETHTKNNSSDEGRASPNNPAFEVCK